MLAAPNLDAYGIAAGLTGLLAERGAVYGTAPGDTAPGRDRGERGRKRGTGSSARTASAT